MLVLHAIDKGCCKELRLAMSCVESPVRPHDAHGSAIQCLIVHVLKSPLSYKQNSS